MRITRLAGRIALLGVCFTCSAIAQSGVGSGPSPYLVPPDAAAHLARLAPYVGPPPAPPRGARFDAEHYEVRAAVDPAGERLRARARIWLRRVGERPAGSPTAGSRAAVTDTLRLKAGDGLRVSSADVDGHPVDARRADGELLLPLPPGPTDRPGIVVTLEYEASARGGLRISEEAAFTYFHTDSWLPVHGDLDDRATLDLLVETPLRWRVVAPGGRLKPPEPYFDSTMRWVLVEPAPPYLFGFAAAPLRETRLDDFRNPTLLVLVHHDVPEAEVRRAFRDTRRMVAFLEEKAGIPLHPSVYRQVLLPDAPPQEVMTYTLLPRGYLDALLADPTEDYLIVHELAHQ